MISIHQLSIASPSDRAAVKPKIYLVTTLIATGCRDGPEEELLTSVGSAPELFLGDGLEVVGD